MIFFPLPLAIPKEASPGSESRFRHLVMNSSRKTVNQTGFANKHKTVSPKGSPETKLY